ncbi:reverse transcriptase domain-containing protein [Tanacetum coccineum]
MLADIAETLEKLWAINLKLNTKNAPSGLTTTPNGQRDAKPQQKDSGPRKLRRYFQAHPIQVLSDKPIKQILAKPKKSGRIAKWAIELGEHEIEFRGRNSIKWKILDDFLAKTPLTESREAKNKEVKRKEPKPENTWKLFTHGASSSGAGLMVVSLEGKGIYIRIEVEFETTNNEAEYEVLLAGLRIAKEMEIRELIIFVDSQLVANQVKGLFEARQPTIKQYLEKTMDLLSNFVKEEGDNWMTPIREYLRSEALPDDPQKARKLRIKAPLYKMIEEKLSCGMHSGPRSVVSKITRLGYYWPSMHKDTKELIQKCEACQIYSSVPRKPKQEMTSIMSAWPFSKWGIDIVGPFLTAPGGAIFLVLAIDYFTKWVKVKPLVSTTGRHMEKFVWEHIVCRFGRPQVVISDNRKQFLEGTFPVFCKKLGTLQASTSVYHPQANGQEAVIPIEISVETKRVQDFDPKENKKRRREDMDILEERREMASIKETHYKQKMEGYFNKNVKPSTFKPSTNVLRLNSASKAEYQGKMGPTWEGDF